MKARQLEKMGFPATLAKPAKWVASAARQAGMDLETTRARLQQILDDPESLRDDPLFGELAVEMHRHQLAEANRIAQANRPPRTTPAPYRQWGDDLDENAIKQIETARYLPISARAALMPDAHLGYGLPIGGVLATRNAVIPYAVGVDIACRVKLTLLDLPPKTLTSESERLENAIESETRFGIGAEFGNSSKNKHLPSSRFTSSAGLREHPVMEEDWSVSPITANLKDKAHRQLGSSGSGNHFVEFGTLTISDEHAKSLNLSEGGTYLALLSHSGSRGTGAAVCDYYSKLAMHLHPELERDQRHLAWLDLDSHEGAEYWAAMNLMGRYASANHACIHDSIIRHLSATALATIENHHNFAWKETHIDPETLVESEFIVHRKGATPAGLDVLGFIPGSMATPGYLVRGLGHPDALHSASHGAGRLMSRRQAKLNFRWNHITPTLEKAGIRLISAGIDENPNVYKDIHTVMAAQADLVTPIARFDPKLVKMAPEGERPED